VELRSEEKFCRVEVVPVTQFMGEDSFDFLGLKLLDQGVKDDDVLALPKIELKKRRWMMSLPREVRRSTH